MQHLECSLYCGAVDGNDWMGYKCPNIYTHFGNNPDKLNPFWSHGLGEMKAWVLNCALSYLANLQIINF